jgi:ribonuclease D
MLDPLLNDLIDLTIAGNRLPRGLDFRFQSLNSTFRDQISGAASHTLSLLSDLTAFVLGDSPTDSDSSVDTDRAIRSLLDSPDLDCLDRPPPKPSSFVHIERYLSNNVEFIFSRTVPKPPRFSQSIPPPPSIPIVTAVPDVFNPRVGQLSMSAVRYVARPELVVAACRAISVAYSRGPVYVGVQTHRARTYRPIPCFVCLMTPDYSVDVIDILSCREQLGPLSELLQNPDMVHVMFAPDADLAVLAESLGIWVTNVFDAGGEPGSILDSALDSFQLKKCLVDWRIRPVTEELLLIAARTVWYLPFLTDKLAKSRPGEELLELCARFGDPPPTRYVFGDRDVEWLVREIALEADDLDEVALKILGDLVTWRNSIAVLEDESPNFVGPNRALLRIAQNHPLTAGELDHCLDGCSTPSLDSYRADLIAVVKKYIAPTSTSYPMFAK